MLKLRSYQQASVDKCLNYVGQTPKRYKKPQIIVQPTGSGKSLVISNLAYKLNHPVLVLQPTKEILLQNYSKLKSFGGEASIYSASVGQKELTQLTYATLGSVKKLGKTFKNLGVKTLLIDEAHTSFSPDRGSMFMNFVKDLTPENSFGFTATPFRLKPYGNIDNSWTQLNMLNYGRPTYFKQFLDIVQVSNIVQKGYWAELKYELYKFDDSHLVLNTSGTEFTQDSIKQAISHLNINNNIYLLIKRKLQEDRKKIIVFMDSVENCHIMANALGDVAAVVSGETKKKERSALVERFNNTESLKVILNHSALGIGFDAPCIDTVILGRPTNSLSNIYQYVGRGCRPFDVKKSTQIVDFCGNIQRFGKLETLEYKQHPNGNLYVVIGGKVVSGVALDKPKPLWSDFVSNPNMIY